MLIGCFCQAIPACWHSTIHTSTHMHITPSKTPTCVFPSLFSVWQLSLAAAPGSAELLLPFCTVNVYSGDSSQAGSTTAQPPISWQQAETIHWMSALWSAMLLLPKGNYSPWYLFLDFLGFFFIIWYPTYPVTMSLYTSLYVVRKSHSSVCFKSFSFF